MRYFIQISYNGLPYKGWQRQPSAISVQEIIESCLSIVYHHPIEVVGCGRTDTGVHAKNYIAQFDIEHELPKNILLRLNKLLPKNIAVENIRPVKNGIHARFDATSRTYKYFIHFKKDPFLQDRSFWIHSHAFDLEKMNLAAAKLLTYSNFATFEKKGSDNKSSICNLYQAKWEVINENEWCFTISANRFLRNMVRRITGTLLMIGINRMTINEMESALNKHDILEVNIAPPAYGLFLWEIEYPLNIFLD